jgi:uncharacterized membrane protein
MKRSVRLFAVVMVLVVGTLTWSQSATAGKSPLDRSSKLMRLLQKPDVKPGARVMNASGAVTVKPLAAAAHVYKFATADYPGASLSEATATAAGTTVGLFSYGSTSATFSFKLKGGVYTTYTVPGSAGTVAFSVNSVGQIVGAYVDNLGATHGFVDTAGTVADVDFPGAMATIITDINTAGDLAGIWEDAASNQHGFIDQAGTFTSLDFPGTGITFTEAAGINASDEIVGIFDDASSVQHGFIWKAGVFTQLDAPLSTSTTAFGVNDASQISGSFSDASSNDHGFLYAGGIFNQIDVLGAKATQLTHINKTTFAGYFVDQSDEDHGVTGH